MGIRLKIAETAKERDDVFWIRHQVYTVEEGYFADNKHEHIVDRFDTHPMCANLIAYEGDEPIATIRLNLDSGVGLPSEELYDFKLHRKRIQSDFEKQS